MRFPSVLDRTAPACYTQKATPSGETPVEKLLRRITVDRNALCGKWLDTARHDVARDTGLGGSP